MVRAVLYAAAVVILLYTLLCALLYLAQDRLLYLPTPEVSRPAAVSVRLQRNDVVLRIWVLHPEAPAALLYFGGNAEDVGANLSDFAATFTDRAVYLMNYRGYGGSTGRPAETALIGDAVATYDWIAERHAHIAVIGRSLGSGIAVALAARRAVDGLVLITPYDSIANVAADHFPWFPVRWLIHDRYDSLARIAQLRAPVLALIAEHDEVVRRARSDALIAAIPAHLRHTVLVNGATHNDISSSPAYLRSLKEFLPVPP